MSSIGSLKGEALNQAIEALSEVGAAFSAVELLRPENVREALDLLATATGGSVISADDPAALETTFGDIASELLSSYRLEFTAEAYVLTKDEGGRHTPFFKGYRPQFYFRTTDVTGLVELPEGTEMVMPGDTVSISVDLHTPIAMDEGLRFAIREGGRTVGAGTVTDITE